MYARKNILFDIPSGGGRITTPKKTQQINYWVFLKEKG
jgi:hypothetical protein